MTKVSIAAKAAGLAVAGLLFVPSVASAQLCVLGIFVAAIHKNATENRELTQKEAMTCGLVSEPAAAEKPKKMKKAARRAKPE